jgi:hypothetical protein
MAQPEYQTIFEIGLRSIPWSTVLHPLPFIIIGVLLLRFARAKSAQITGVAVASMATLFSLILAVISVAKFIKLRSAYRNGDSAVVQGFVENFHPAPPLGPARESFSVNGISFFSTSLRLGLTSTMVRLMRGRFVWAWAFESTIRKEAFGAWAFVTRIAPVAGLQENGLNDRN